MEITNQEIVNGSPPKIIGKRETLIGREWRGRDDSRVNIFHWYWIRICVGANVPEGNILMKKLWNRLVSWFMEWDNE